MIHRPARAWLKALLFSAGLALVGAGCQDAPPPAPPTPPPEAQFDVTKTTCDTLADARAKVAAAYEASIRAAGETYAAAREAFQADLNDCRANLWKGGPCDEQAKAADQAYKNAWGDIANDQFYKEWKKAKADFDECFKNWDKKWDEYAEKNKNGEKRCQEEFQAKVDAATAAYDAAVAAAKAKRDADNAFLDALEKKCKEPTFSGDLVVPKGETKDLELKGDVGGGTTVPPGTTPPGGGIVPPGPGMTPPGGTIYRPDARACQDAVPGENAAPRTGRATDFGPRDIAINLATQVAEDITKTPVPVSAIDDRIFAGIVCAKLTSRLWELQMEEIDAITSGNKRQEIAVRQKIARYERAKQIWCKIAEGRPALPEVKKAVAEVNAMPTGACKTDADCGTPVCCSASQVGTPTCDVETGACSYTKARCADPKVCGGNPAQCVDPPRKVRAILYNGKYLPVDQLKTENEAGCTADHWHAKSGSVQATDGTMVADPGPQCGFGKVKDRPVVEIEVPAARIEVRGLEGLKTR